MTTAGIFVGRKYEIGEKADECDVGLLLGVSTKEVEHATTLVEEGDSAFVKRSDGFWRFAVAVRKGLEPKRFIEFQVRRDGCTKKISHDLWSEFVRPISGFLDSGDLNAQKSKKITAPLLRRTGFFIVMDSERVDSSKTVAKSEAADRHGCGVSDSSVDQDLATSQGVCAESELPGDFSNELGRGPANDTPANYEVATTTQLSSESMYTEIDMNSESERGRTNDGLQKKCESSPVKVSDEEDSPRTRRRTERNTKGTLTASTTFRGAFSMLLSGQKEKGDIITTPKQNNTPNRHKQNQNGHVFDSGSAVENATINDAENSNSPESHSEHSQSSTTITHDRNGVMGTATNALEKSSRSKNRSSENSGGDDGYTGPNRVDKSSLTTGNRRAPRDRGKLSVSTIVASRQMSFKRTPSKKAAREVTSAKAAELQSLFDMVMSKDAID